ncbi:MAG: D-aminoacyl-tRNA deacylase [Bacteroidia bacterium]
MRALIQRVSEARVDIAGQTVGRINRGYMVLLGIEEADDSRDVLWLSKKIALMRLFSDEDGKMNRSLSDVGGGILLISQFTLHALTAKGNRPSFIRAARPEQAIPLYEAMIYALKEEGIPVETGQFGADMQVHLCNDGPVSIWIDSQNRE